ncbi:MAG: transketolase C-terminal domain-containing protein, partial [Thermoanaerobaculia bacterium]
GFQRSAGDDEGYDLYSVKGWDYPSLCETYLFAAEIVRREHVPAIVHVTELTQPQGHSTSGSHERYKSAARLAWEREYDCLVKMREWMIEMGIVGEEQLDRIEEEDRGLVTELQRRAWEAVRRPLEEERRRVSSLIAEAAAGSSHQKAVEIIGAKLANKQNPLRRDLLAAVQEVLVAIRDEELEAKPKLIEWRSSTLEEGKERYGSDLLASGPGSILEVAEVKPKYAPESPRINGFEVLNRCFDAALGRYRNLVAFGEDLGKLGDVNQGFVGLQEKYGELRVADTGIREMTILGQAIGLALRGIRPIAEIQYLDYLLYALQIMSDDLATLRWRTKGGQKAPVIIRTRGHRLEGIWHSGSPMGAIMNLLRGVYICVPRNMVRAAGFYNLLLQGDDPALVVEVLNGYRLKEKLPTNIGELTVPLGVPDILRKGSDVTLVTYGACCRIAQEAARQLAEVGIETEIIDVQTLQPFDRHGRIVESLEKTGRIVFVDEDVPGGASAFMLQQVLEKQGGYEWLDAGPRTVTGREHRPAYGSDGDYFSKPNREEIFDAVYDLMHETDPKGFPIFNR